MARTIEQIAAKPAVGDVIIDPLCIEVEVRDVDSEGSVFIQSPGEWPKWWSKDAWTLLCRNSTLPEQKE